MASSSSPSKKYIKSLSPLDRKNNRSGGRGKRRGGKSNYYSPPQFPPNTEQPEDLTVIGNPEEIFSEMVAECQEALQDNEAESFKEKKYEGAEAITRFHHAVKSFQKIVLYETKARFYLIGSSPQQDEFHILKIDRTEPEKLVITEDEHTYDNAGLQDALKMLETGNRSKVGQKLGSGMNKVCAAFGLVGFVKFLEGYYMLLITGRNQVALLGQHSIYAVMDTKLIYIPNDDVRIRHSDENRYVKMFNAIDLSSNFYFSYSYDLTNTIQYNLKDPQEVKVGNKSKTIQELFSGSKNVPPNLSYESQTHERYVWNSFLLNAMEKSAVVSFDWILPIIHGFVDQCNINIYGRSVFITLIARRSSTFAGTRFLKRGANFKGDVANQVETEQIVHEAVCSNLSLSKVTSFVQIRGSVPSHWAQTTGGGKIVPKPPIFFTLSDPYGRTSGHHFNQLLTKYGAPILVVNLVKKEKSRKTKHESLLSEEYQKQIEYLNIFLPRRFKIEYLHFDMSRNQKREVITATEHFQTITGHGLEKTGIFVSHPKLWATINHPRKQCKITNAYREKLLKFLDEKAKRGANMSSPHMDQTGVIRTNCVDCLDRTNNAQCMIGMVALGLQFYALGLVSEPKIEILSDTGRMLENMFADHGDTLSLQYGGSALIHRIQSYRKHKWTNKANDVAQTIKRYYANTVSDTEKQNSINLFLGVFKPIKGKPPIWDTKEYSSDVYWHLPELFEDRFDDSFLSTVNTQWWDPRLRSVFPRPTHESNKACVMLSKYLPSDSLFEEYYHQPYGKHHLHADLFVMKCNDSIRDIMPNADANYSPFAIRNRPSKRMEDVMNSLKASAPSLSRFLPSFLTSGSSARQAKKAREEAAAAAAATASSGVTPAIDALTANDDSDEDLDLTSDDPNDDLFVLDNNRRLRMRNKRDAIKAILPLRDNFGAKKLKIAAAAAMAKKTPPEKLYGQKSEDIKWWPGKRHSEKDVQIMKEFSMQSTISANQKRNLGQTTLSNIMVRKKDFFLDEIKISKTALLPFVKDGRMYQLSERDKDLLREFRSAYKSNEKKIPMEILRKHSNIKKMEKFENELKLQDKSVEDAFRECSSVVGEYTSTFDIKSLCMGIKPGVVVEDEAKIEKIGKLPRQEDVENTEHLGARRKQPVKSQKGEKQKDCQKETEPILPLSKIANNC